jgi:hypothetical protein
MNKICLYFLIFVVVLFAADALLAQGYDATGMALGGAYGARARGVDAIAWNPAQLALPRSKKIELNLVGLNVNIANSSLSINNYERYLTESGHGGEWSESDIEEILDLIPEDGLDITGDVNANALGLAVAHFGISFQAIGKALGVMPKEPVELFLKGNLKDNYIFNTLDGDGFSALKISIAGSHPVKFKKYFDTFAVGMNFNYYRGFAVFEATHSEGFFYTGLDYIQAKMDVIGRKAEGGIGYSFDLGAAGEINEKWSASLAIKNVIGGITWNVNTEEMHYSAELDSVQYVDGEDAEAETMDTTYAIDAFRTRLPVVFHLGLAYQLTPKILLLLDLEQAAENNMGYSDQGMLAIGAEYSPVAFLPLRGGMSFGGKWGYKFGMGFGLHFGVFHFDIAYSMHRALWPTASRGISTALNLKFLI